MTSDQWINQFEEEFATALQNLSDEDLTELEEIYREAFTCGWNALAEILLEILGDARI